MVKSGMILRTRTLQKLMTKKNVIGATNSTTKISAEGSSIK